MKITKYHRTKLTYYLKKFYSYYPYEKYTIFKFVRLFRQRVNLDRDIWMGVSGETGGGKSFFMLMVLALFGKRTCDLSKNIAYIPKGEEISEKFNALNKNILIVDEAAKEMRSVNWQSKAQQKVNTTAMTDRFKNNWVMFAMPSFKEFTKSMRQSNMQFRAIVLYRTDKFARVVIQRKSKNWRSDDPWLDKKASDIYTKLMKSRRKELSNEEVLNVERKLSNTIMDFIIPDLSLILPDVVNKYEELKLKSRNPDETDEVKDENKRETKYQDLYGALLNRLTKLIINDELDLKNRSRPVSRAELGQMLHISPSKIAQAFKDQRLEEAKPPNFRI